MNYLQAEHISKSYGDLLLFDDISLSVDKHQKIALIARNGAGKSTLLSILACKELPDAGAIHSRNGLSVGYLPQVPELQAEASVLSQVMVSLPEVSEVIQTYEQALRSHDHARLDAAMSEMDRLQAWDYESRVKEVLTRLNLTDFDKRIKHLSGGQKKRVALAAVLVAQPDLLILDEPTNHLDMKMIEWLEDQLSAHPVTLMMVTHDRYFLDRVCTDILELADGQLYAYQGNYQEYLDKRQVRIGLLQRSADKAASLMKKELEWVRRMPKARGTKAKYRMDAFAQLKESARLEIEPELGEIRIESLRLGKKVMEIENLSKAYDNHKLFEGFSYKFQRFERIGLIGKNGVGKTTFLETITGKMAPDTGQVDVGSTVRFGFYEQQGITFNQEDQVIDVVKRIAEVVHLGKGRSMSASQFLEYFLFPPELQYGYISRLSGGEKRRLYLCTVLMRNPNFLILDEPTNDLDIMTLNVLEDYLLHFAGCVMIVSHDRYFMDKVVDHLFVFEGNGVVRDFPGNYSIYRDYLADQPVPDQQQQKTKKEKPRNKSAEVRRKLSFKEKLELQQLDQELEEMNGEKDRLEKEISSGLCSPDELQQKSSRIGELITLLDEKEFRWLELSEYEK